ncbi:MAG: hypothetical protein KKH88_02070 [Nanoarchaeota archaeon]|nr:hypothetical protein [Nanoarchaeota archaeon]
MRLKSLVGASLALLLATAPIPIEQITPSLNDSKLEYAKVEEQTNLAKRLTEEEIKLAQREAKICWFHFGLRSSETGYLEAKYGKPFYGRNITNKRDSKGNPIGSRCWGPDQIHPITVKQLKNEDRISQEDFDLAMEEVYNKMKKSHPEYIVPGNVIENPSQELIDAFNRIGFATCGYVLDRAGNEDFRLAANIYRWGEQRVKNRDAALKRGESVKMDHRYFNKLEESLGEHFFQT